MLIVQRIVRLVSSILFFCHLCTAGLSFAQGSAIQANPVGKDPLLSASFHYREVFGLPEYQQVSTLGSTLAGCSVLLLPGFAESFNAMVISQTRIMFAGELVNSPSLSPEEVAFIRALSFDEDSFDRWLQRCKGVLSPECEFSALQKKEFKKFSRVLPQLRQILLIKLNAAMDSRSPCQVLNEQAYEIISPFFPAQFIERQYPDDFSSDDGHIYWMNHDYVRMRIGEYDFIVDLALRWFTAEPTGVVVIPVAASLRAGWVFTEGEEIICAGTRDLSGHRSDPSFVGGFALRDDSLPLTLPKFYRQGYSVLRNSVGMETSI